MSSELPQKKDQLFTEEKDMRRGAWLKNPANAFFSYSEGYKYAGRYLYDKCFESAYDANTLVFPMIFNYRQFIELRLKELTMMSNNYLDNDDDFEDTHNLMSLWNTYRHDLLPQIDENIDPEMLKNAEQVIVQFHKEDPKSMVFRYPVSKGEKRKEHIVRDTIDLVNFKEVIDRLINFLDGQWEIISNYGDLKADWMEEMKMGYYL